MFRFRLLAQKRVISMNLGLFIELISYYFKIIREKVQYKHQEFKEQKVRKKIHDFDLTSEKVVCRSGHSVSSV